MFRASVICAMLLCAAIVSAAPKRKFAPEHREIEDSAPGFELDGPQKFDAENVVEKSQNVYQQLIVEEDQRNTEEGQVNVEQTEEKHEIVDREQNVVEKQQQNDEEEQRFSEKHQLNVVEQQIVDMGKPVEKEQNVDKQHTSEEQQNTEQQEQVVEEQQLSAKNLEQTFVPEAQSNLSPSLLKYGMVPLLDDLYTSMTLSLGEEDMEVVPSILEYSDEKKQENIKDSTEEDVQVLKLENNENLADEKTEENVKLSSNEKLKSNFFSTDEESSNKNNEVLKDTDEKSVKPLSNETTEQQNTNLISNGENKDQEKIKGTSDVDIEIQKSNPVLSSENKDQEKVKESSNQTTEEQKSDSVLQAEKPHKNEIETPANTTPLLKSNLPNEKLEIKDIKEDIIKDVGDAIKGKIDQVQTDILDAKHKFEERFQSVRERIKEKNQYIQEAIQQKKDKVNEFIDKFIFHINSTTTTTESSGQMTTDGTGSTDPPPGPPDVRYEAPIELTELPQDSDSVSEDFINVSENEEQLKNGIVESPLEVF